MAKVKEKKRYEINMTEGRVFGKLIAFALPLMATGVLQCLYNAADLIVVGRFAGDGPLAAVGATGTLISLIVNLFVSMAIGTSVTVAAAVGARDEERVERLVHTSIAFSLVGGLITMLVGVIFARDFLLLLDTPDDIIDMSTLYMQIYFSGSIFSMFYNFGASVLRATGDSRRPLYYLFISGLVNVVLNLFFVLVLGMDVDGVAYATIISQMISAVMVFVALVQETGACRLVLRRIRFCRRELSDIVRIGLPASIQSLVFSISNSIIQAAINSFDKVAIAGHTASSNIDNIVYTAMYTTSTAAVTAVGQNVGAGKYRRILHILFDCLLITTVIWAIFGGGVLLFQRELLGIYLPNSPQAVEYGILRFSVITTTYFLCGWMDTITGVTRGMGSSLVPMIVSVIGVCGVRLAWIYTVFTANHDLTTLYWSYPVSWSFTALLQLVLCLIVRHRLAAQQKEIVMEETIPC